jgi:hypothetical protein
MRWPYCGDVYPSVFEYNDHMGRYHKYPPRTGLPKRIRLDCPKCHQCSWVDEDDVEGRARFARNHVVCR